MRRNTLYIILSIISILSLFITAATCSFCGMQLGTASSETESTTESEQETALQETEDTKDMAADETHRDVQTEDQSGNEEEADASVEEEVNHDPVITNVVADEVELDLSDEFRVLVGENTNFLVLAEDQDGDELSYSVSDSIGNNMETVKMDNTAAGFGWVAPSDPGLYDIYITVSDSIGKDAAATVHVTVNAIPEAHLLQTERLNIIGGRSGSYRDDGDTNGIIYTGDDEEDYTYQAYLCFDISSLAGLDITDAQLEIGNIREFGEPLDFYDTLSFYTGDLFTGGGFAPEGLTGVIAIHPINELGESLTRTSNVLVSTIQEAIDSGRNWYYLVIEVHGIHMNEASGNSEKDGYRFMLEGLFLELNYFE